MKKWLFPPKSIFIRFTLSFVLVGLIPLAFFTGVTLSRFSQTMRENAVQSTRQMMTLIADNLNVRLKDIAHQTNIMYLYQNATYGTLREILLRDTAGYDASTYFAMKDFTKGTLEANANLRSVFFIDTVNNKQYSRSVSQVKPLRPSFDWLSLPYVQSALENPRALTVSLPHVESYYQNSTEQVLTLGRAFLDTGELPMRERILGVLLLDIPYSFFNELLTQYDWAAMGELDILNAKDEAIFSVGTSPSHGSGSLAIANPIPAAGWVIRYNLDQDALARRVTILQGFSFIMIAIAAISSILLAILCSRSLAAPIKRLLRQMKRVQRGDMDARVEPVGGGELGEVNEGFNRMVDDLRIYIDRSYISKLRQTEAELNNLKTQIHPHFLYNTLEVIRMTAIENSDLPSATMIQALAKQLKYVIGEVRDKVPLHQEVEMVQTYLGLISMRYGNICLDVHIPKALLQCEVLKLCLQPVVENAVQHGLRPKGGGSIDVTAAQKDDSLVLTVMDDGGGMPQDQLTKLETLLHGETLGRKTEEGWRSIGLKNVHDRIRLAYGSEYGLLVRSRENVGTAVMIRMPYQVEEDCHEAADRG